METWTAPTADELAAAGPDAPGQWAAGGTGDAWLAMAAETVAEAVAAPAHESAGRLSSAQDSLRRAYADLVSDSDQEPSDRARREGRLLALAEVVQASMLAGVRERRAASA